MSADLYYTQVCRQVIDANRKHGRNDPPVNFRKGKRGKATYAHEIELPAGSRIIYSPHEPVLPSGARLVIVSTDAPTVLR